MAIYEHQQIRKFDVGKIGWLQEVAEFSKNFPEKIRSENDPEALVRLLVDYLVAQRRMYQLLADWSVETDTKEGANKMVEYFSVSLVGENEKAVLFFLMTHVRYNERMMEAKGETKDLDLWEKLDGAIMDVMAQVP